MAEMGGDQGEGENPRVFSSSPPSLVLPTPPKADQPLAEREGKLHCNSDKYYLSNKS